MTEAEIMAELRLLAQDMTILAITHRRTVIAAGDRVVQLTAGVAMESSGH
jgi:ABC-type transport system involved in cytochrome bd biosynthesis fused ATPase/permease subunit